MMTQRMTAVTIALAFLAPLAAAGILPDEVCTSAPDLCALVDEVAGNAVIGDQTIEDGEEQEYDDGSFVMTGDTEVEDGGKLVFNDSDVSITNESNGIIVRNGGELQIVNTSAFGVIGDPRSLPLIRLDPGAIVTLTQSSFTGFPVELASNLSTVENLIFAGAPFGLLLETVDVDVDQCIFRDMGTSLRVRGGSPTITLGEFFRGEQEIHAIDTDITVEYANMQDSVNGLLMEGSKGRLAFSWFDDDGDPFSTGVAVYNATGPVAIENNEFQQWHTAIRTRNSASYVTLTGNTFHDNVENADPFNT